MSNNSDLAAYRYLYPIKVINLTRRTPTYESPSITSVYFSDNLMKFKSKQVSAPISLDLGVSLWVFIFSNLATLGPDIWQNLYIIKELYCHCSLFLVPSFLFQEIRVYDSPPSPSLADSQLVPGEKMGGELDRSLTGDWTSMVGGGWGEGGEWFGAASASPWLLPTGDTVLAASLSVIPLAALPPNLHHLTKVTSTNHWRPLKPVQGGRARIAKATLLTSQLSDTKQQKYSL